MMKIARYVPALVLLAGVSIAAPACAQTYGYGGYGRYPDRGYAREIERRAYDNGYREGLEEGRNDARHDRNYSYQRHDEYRDADDGYHRGDGDPDFYRRAYRAGFQAGYDESYNRYARYGGYRDRGWWK